MFPRRALLAAAPLFLAGCASAPRIIEGLPSSPSPSASPSTLPTPSIATEVPLDPLPTPTIPYDKSAGWYLDRIPEFAPAPKPEQVGLPNGGSTPWWSRVPTNHKVAFITIDDGGLIRSAEAKEMIRRAKIPVTLFLNSPAATNYAEYFKEIQATGAGVQNHTVTHRNLKGQSYDFQKKEINDCADRIAHVYGVRPYLFRPPFGDYDSVTLKAARDSGMAVSFFWTQTVDQGIVHYQSKEKTVRPGDVLLMHFRPQLADDLLNTLRAIKESGLTPARLEDYIPRPGA